jgi:hypothetical protein
MGGLAVVVCQWEWIVETFRTISDHGSSVEHRGTEVVRHNSAMVDRGCNTTTVISLSSR